MCRDQLFLVFSSVNAACSGQGKLVSCKFGATFGFRFRDVVIKRVPREVAQRFWHRFGQWFCVVTFGCTSTEAECYRGRVFENLAGITSKGWMHCRLQIHGRFSEQKDFTSSLPELYISVKETYHRKMDDNGEDRSHKNVPRRQETEKEANEEEPISRFSGLDDVNPAKIALHKTDPPAWVALFTSGAFDFEKSQCPAADVAAALLMIPRWGGMTTKPNLSQVQDVNAVETVSHQDNSSLGVSWRAQTRSTVSI
ncbi:hypothetical protein NM208_g10536 [Fusarium decemcellulare]|uniref:Uncharacterized protein n=1 Tax=Fusarium decemcellulare TaxID=57161 RepID=A0ACC1RXL7_9HYPO|nr:hypothetical protein NM208_g10536 [Fusarium decemcellulare]